MLRKEKKMDIKPQLITQGHHCGYYWHLMANAMLLGTSRAHTARLLGKSPSAWLKAPSSSPAVWSSVVVLSPQYLFHQKPLLSLLGWAKWGTHGRKGWEINAKTTQLSGSESRHKALSPGTKPTLGCRGFYLLPAHQLSSNIKIYTNMCFLHSPPKAETISKSGLGQRSVIRQGQAISKVPRKRT